MNMKNTLLKRTVQLALLAAVLSSSSCKEDKKAVIYLLIDRSVSVSDRFTRMAYSEDAKKITSKLMEGDIIILNTITANSLATSSPQVFEIPKYDVFGENADRHSLLIDSVLEVAAGAAQKIISEAPEEQTDVLNSVSNAAELLMNKEYSDYSKTIVILSDMEQITDELDLSDKGLGVKDVESILRKLREKNRIADMSGLRIIVTGAGYSQSGNNSFEIKKTQFLKKFWTEYFKSCNATMRDSDYGARLVDFNR
jgi:hypothetical protein